MTRITYLAVALSSFLFGCASDKTLSDSKERWHPREAYLQTIETDELEDLAKKGDREARFHLAVRLMSGDRTGKDESRAALIAREDALEGDPRAKYLFGAALYSGLGVEKNEIEAARWFRESAQEGYVSAEYWHGFMLSWGHGYETPDWTQAVQWFRRAADKGHVDAQFTLGEAFHTCRGDLPRDFEKAAYWYRHAYDQGNGSPLARENLQRLIDQGFITWQDGDPGAPPIAVQSVDPDIVYPCS